MNSCAGLRGCIGSRSARAHSSVLPSWRTPRANSDSACSRFSRRNSSIAKPGKVGGHKLGTWYDHEAEVGGGPLDLVEIKGGMSREEAEAWLEQEGFAAPRRRAKAATGTSDRRISVAPAKGGGRSRWLGGGRTLSARVCHAAERIVAGAAPGCTLSRRAEARLAKVRERLAFVDGRSLPIVAEGENHVRVWPLAGGLASASLERALAQSGLASTRWDDFSTSVRATSTDPVARAIAKINPTDASPRLPANIAAALKFSSCLPNSITAAVLCARTAVPDVIAEDLSRPIRQL